VTVQLPPNFRQKDIQKIRELVEQSTSFTVIGMPGMGISTFLKFLISHDFAYFVHVDLYELPKLDKASLFKLLAQSLGVTPKNIKQKLFILSQKYARVVIVFNRFDQLKDEFDESLFSNLRSLTEIDKEKIVMIFSSNKPLYKWNPNAFERTNLDLFAKNFFLKPYSSDELKILLNKKDLLDKYLKLSGGHFQLLQLLCKSERRSSYLSDYFINLQVRRIYEECLDHKQKQIVQKIALGKKLKNIDKYLTDIGIVNKSQKNYSLFSPLLSDYIKSVTVTSLTQTENKLLKLLENQKGEIVSKENIFEALWPEVDKQSDWALNALIYRLRKNQAFKNIGYTIQNIKKQGYRLIE